MTTSSTCKIGDALTQLTPEDRSDVEAILDNSVSSVVIAKWFTDVRKFQGCSTAAVNAHRKGDCDCGRTRRPNGHKRRRR